MYAVKEVSNAVYCTYATRFIVLGLKLNLIKFSANNVIWIQKIMKARLMLDQSN